MVDAFKPDNYIAAVQTNNGLERQIESLKYEYHAGYKNCTISDNLTIIVERFIQDTYQR